MIFAENHLPICKNHSQNLRGNIKTLHEGHKDYKCGSCDKSFTGATSLMIHIKTIHEYHKDFKREYCSILLLGRHFYIRHIYNRCFCFRHFYSGKIAVRRFYSRRNNRMVFCPYPKDIEFIVYYLCNKKMAKEQLEIENRSKIQTTIQKFQNSYYVLT